MRLSIELQYKESRTVSHCLIIMYVIVFDFLLAATLVKAVTEKDGTRHLELECDPALTFIQNLTR